MVRRSAWGVLCAVDVDRARVPAVEVTICSGGVDRVSCVSSFPGTTHSIHRRVMRLGRCIIDAAMSNHCKHRSITTHCLLYFWCGARYRIRQRYRLGEQGGARICRSSDGAGGGRRLRPQPDGRGSKRHCGSCKCRHGHSASDWQGNLKAISAFGKVGAYRRYHGAAVAVEGAAGGRGRG